MGCSALSSALLSALPSTMDRLRRLRKRKLPLTLASEMAPWKNYFPGTDRDQTHSTPYVPNTNIWKSYKAFTISSGGPPPAAEAFTTRTAAGGTGPAAAAAPRAAAAAAPRPAAGRGSPPPPPTPATTAAPRAAAAPRAEVAATPRVAAAPRAEAAATPRSAAAPRAAAPAEGGDGGEDPVDDQQDLPNEQDEEGFHNQMVHEDGGEDPNPDVSHFYKFLHARLTFSNNILKIPYYYLLIS